MVSANAGSLPIPAIAVLLAAQAKPTFAFGINLRKGHVAAARLAVIRLLDKTPKEMKEEESLASTIYNAGKAPLAFAVLRNSNLISGYSEWLLAQTLLENGHEKAAQLLLSRNLLSDKASVNAIRKLISSQ